MVTQEVTPAV